MRQTWATPWIGTPEFGTMTAQLVAWTLPPQDSEGIDVQFSPGEAGELNVEVTSFDDEGGPRNFYRTVLRLVSPDLDPTQTVLEQVGLGRYAGTVRAEDPGAYLVRVAQTFEDEDGTDAASRTLGIVSPAAAEYRRLGVDAEALAGFADTGLGRVLRLDDEDATQTVWRHDIEASAFPTPIWPWLLLLAILLVPLDVGVRRVALTRGDFRRARAWMARRVGLARAEPEAVPGLAELRAARERGDRRTGRAMPAARPVEPEDASGGVATAPPPASSAPAPPRRPEAAPRRAAGPHGGRRAYRPRRHHLRPRPRTSRAARRSPSASRVGAAAAEPLSRARAPRGRRHRRAAAHRRPVAAREGRAARPRRRGAERRSGSMGARGSRRSRRR